MNARNNDEKNRKPEPSKGAPLTNAEFQEWLDECERLATCAGFQGLLQVYFAEQPSQQYPALAIGAREILDRVVCSILSEGEPEKVCAESGVSDLIYSESY